MSSLVNLDVVELANALTKKGISGALVGRLEGEVYSIQTVTIIIRLA